MLNIRTLLGLVVVAIALSGCGKPLPPEKSHYAGEWQAPSMYLLITQGGQIEYRRKQGSVSKSIDGPIKGFDGDNFEVGIGPMSTIFVVSKPPFQDGDKWKMVVDGVELTRNDR